MKIEEGKTYTRRDGEIVGPAVRIESLHYPWQVGFHKYTNDGFFFGPDGDGVQSTNALDLVAYGGKK